MSRLIALTIASLAFSACGGADALASTGSSDDALLADDGSTGGTDDAGCHRGRGPRRPPKEAFTACASLADGATCSFSHRGRTVEGICRATPEGDAQACAPNGPPPGERRGPPQEAVDACQGLTADAACTFSHDGQSLAGTCRTGPNNEPLACAPAGFGPPPRDR